MTKEKESSEDRSRLFLNSATLKKKPKGKRPHKGVARKKSGKNDYRNARSPLTKQWESGENKEQRGLVGASTLHLRKKKIR